MDDQIYSDPLSSLPAQNKPSGLGLAALIAGIVAVLVVCLTVGLSFASTSMAPRTAETVTSIVGLTAICSLGLGLIGMGLGIAGVLQKAQSKMFAIIGLVLSAVAFLVMCGIMGLGVWALGALGG